MLNWIDHFIQWLNYDDAWIISVFLIVLLSLVLSYCSHRFLKLLAKKAKQTKNLWDDGLVDALRGPVTWFFWLIGMTIAADVVAYHSNTSVLFMTEKVRAVGIVFLVSWFFVRLMKRIENNLTSPEYQKKPMDRTTARALGKLLRVSVVITAVLLIMQTLGYSVSGILAFGGVGGLAIGFAAKDLLANFFGGLMIYLDRPFAVGDWVRSPDRNIEGTIEDIGWRLTRIRTFDKRPLYVPNAVFTQISLENPSRMLNRRIKETIGIRYDDANKMAGIVADVKTVLQNHAEIDTQQTLIVNFNQFAPSSLDFFIYTFTKTTEWVRFHEIKQDIMLRIIAIIESHHAECAFPTSTIHVPALDVSTINQDNMR